jgi:hypothetical protein
MARLYNALLTALKIKKGLALEFASDELKNNKDIVLTAMMQNGEALKFASPALQSDRDVVTSAARHDQLYKFQRIK